MFKDLAYAVRTLRKNPGFVAVAVCSLAIGIGANSAVYSFADALILRPLPVLRPSQVVAISPVSTGMFGAAGGVSYPDYVDLRDRTHSFDGVVASTVAQFGFAAERRTQPRLKYGMFVSGNFFSVLGVTPRVGRAFRADEDRVAGRDAVAVISHELWTGEFAADPGVVGRKIWLSGTEFTVVGVAPASFRTLEQMKPALFVPIAMAATLYDPAHLTKRDARWLDIKARLKGGVTVAQARGDVESVAAALRQTYPKTDAALHWKTETELQMRLENSPPDTSLVVMLGLLALCVLVVACANVAGLLLSRATARSREMALKLAVGASRWSLVRQLLLENLLLAGAGALLGLAVAYGVDVFINTLPLPTDAPVDVAARVDGGVLLFTFAVAAGSTLLFGLLPALRSTKLDLISALKEKDGGTGARSSRLWGRNLIVAGQVALTLVLLIVTGVLLDGFRRQLTRGPGFLTDHLQLMSFDPSLVRYTEAERTLFYKRLLADAKSAPGVVSAALTAEIPISTGGFETTPVVPEGRPVRRDERPPDIFDSVVTPGYFATMAIPVLQGRDFAATDRADTPLVAVVNEHMAQRLWPHESAIGKRIQVGEAPGRWMQVVGVARQSKYMWITEAPMDFLYLPFAQNPHSSMFLIAESRAADAATLAPALRRLVENLDRNMPVFDVRTMADLYQGRAVTTPLMITDLVGGLGVMGLVLSVIGLYGVVSYSVSRRVREFGIRMAVGADRQSVVALVLRQGAVLTLGGLAVGLVAGVVASRGVTSLVMFAFGPVRVLPFVAVSVLLLATTMLGAYVPAVRASRIDPMRALREE